MEENNRLTSDAIAAKEAGMSYGQWKALHPNTEHITAMDDDKYVPCPNCGKPFIQKRNQKYCGAFCQQQYYYRANNEKYRLKQKKIREKRKLKKEHGHGNQ